MQAARIYNSRNVDELIFLDIFATRQKRKINLAVVKQVINECFMPVSIGGGINSISDISDLLNIGADKVVIKSKAISDPDFITTASKVFGAQCIVVSVDVIKVGNEYRIYDLASNHSLHAIDFIKQMEMLGAGEFFINDVNSEGMMNGFDLNVFDALCPVTSLPVIAHGGASKPTDFPQLFEHSNINGIAASSIFHFTQYTPYDIKHAIESAGYPVRQFETNLKEGINL